MRSNLASGFGAASKSNGKSFWLGLLIVYLLGLTWVFFGFYQPGRSELALLNRKIDTAGMTIETLENLKNAKAQVAQNYAELTTRFQDMLVLIPRQRDLPLVIATLESLAEANGVELQDVKYSDSNVPNSKAGAKKQGILGYTDLSLRLKGEFPEMVQFLSSVERRLPAIKLESVVLSSLGVPSSSNGGQSQFEPQLDVRIQGTLSLVGDASGFPSEKAWKPPEIAVDSEPIDANPFLVSFSNEVVWSYELVDNELLGDELLEREDSQAEPEIRSDPSTEELELGLTLTGIVRTDGRNLAIVAIDGKSQMVREGDQLGLIRIVDVEPDGVKVAVRERTTFLKMEGHR